MTFFLLVIEGGTVHAAPVLLESEMAVVYERAEEGSNAVGNLIRGNTFELLEQIQTEDGSLWYRVALSNGVNGYVKGSVSLKKEESDKANDDTQEVGRRDEDAGAQEADRADEENSDVQEADRADEDADAQEADRADEENSDAQEADRADEDADAQEADRADGENGDVQEADRTEEADVSAGRFSEEDISSLPKTYSVSNDSKRLLVKETGSEAEEEQISAEKKNHWWHRIDLAAIAALAIAAGSILGIKLGIRRAAESVIGKRGSGQKGLSGKRKSQRMKKTKQLKRTKQLKKSN